MIAIGCLAPLILGVAGLLVGNWLDGAQGAIWGGVGGLVIGGAVLAAVGWLAGKLKT